MANRVGIKITSVPVLCHNTGLLVKAATGYWQMWQERSEQLDTIKKDDPEEHEGVRSNLQTLAFE
jgi:hypothetical protein